MSAWYKQESLGKGEPQLRKCLPRRVCGQAYGGGAFSCLITDVGGLIMGNVTPGVVFLGAWRKGEQALGSKPVSRTDSWPLHQHLPPNSCFWVPARRPFSGLRSRCGVLKWTLSFPSCIWPWCLSQQQKANPAGKMKRGESLTKKETQTKKTATVVLRF